MNRSDEQQTFLDFVKRGQAAQDAVDGVVRIKREPTFGKPHFDGPTYDPARDKVRLTGQLERIFDLMKDGSWRTLSAIATRTGEPAPSISAQLRHLRKKRFGGHTVEKRHVGHGLFEYRLIVQETF